MKHFIINMMAILILAISCPGGCSVMPPLSGTTACGYTPGNSNVKASQFVDNPEYLRHFIGITALRFMKFDDTAEFDGKLYHRFAVKKIIHYRPFDFYFNGDYWWYDESIQTFILSEDVDYTMAYAREEDRKVYLLMRDNQIATSLDNIENSEWEETVIYDWNLTTGSQWLDNPYLSERGWWREAFLNYGETFPLIEDSDPMIIDGEKCKVFRFPELEMRDYKVGMFIEGIGTLEQGWLCNAFPYVASGSEYQGPNDLNEYGYRLAGVLNSDDELIYESWYPDFSKISRLYLYGDMSGWKSNPEWQLTPVEDSGNPDSHIYKFECGENMEIKAGQKFRISSIDGIYQFSIPQGSASLREDVTANLTSDKEREDIALDFDWKGDLIFDFDHKTILFSNKSGIDGVTADEESRGDTRIYDLMGRELREAQPGTVYIQGGKKHVAR